MPKTIKECNMTMQNKCDALWRMFHEYYGRLGKGTAKGVHLLICPGKGLQEWPWQCLIPWNPLEWVETEQNKSRCNQFAIVTVVTRTHAWSGQEQLFGMQSGCNCCCPFHTARLDSTRKPLTVFELR